MNKKNYNEVFKVLKETTIKYNIIFMIHIFFVSNPQYFMIPVPYNEQILVMNDP